MLNDDLMTPEQKEIARLKYTIAKFKEYDAERKVYIQKQDIEIGMLKSEIDELQDTINALNDPDSTIAEIQRLQKKNANLRKELCNLNRRIALSKVNEYDWAIITGEKVDELFQKLEVLRSKRSLEKTIEHLRKANRELAYRVLHPDDANTFVSKMDEFLNINETQEETI